MPLYVEADVWGFTDRMEVEHLMRKMGYAIPQSCGFYSLPRRYAYYVVEGVADPNEFIRDLERQIKEKEIDASIVKYEIIRIR